MGSSIPHITTYNMALTREQKVKIVKVESKVSGGNVNKSYWKHGVLYGDYLDLRVYQNIKITFNGTDTSKTRREEGQRRDDSLARSKVQLYRLVQANVKKHGRFKPIFATYTFKEDVESLDEGLKNFRRFIRKLNNYLGYNLKYVAVPQIQWERFQKTNKKVWHFHVIYFNCPKLPFSVIDSFWGQGSNAVNTQFVRGIRDVGCYIAGYFNKQDISEVPLNRKYYYTSRGLIRPVDIFHNDTIENILIPGTFKVLKVFEGANFTQIKYKLL
jgi:hypothetical protein